jgi:hypothetical protein
LDILFNYSFKLKAKKEDIMRTKKMSVALMIGVICFILLAIPTIASADVDLAVASIGRVGVVTTIEGPVVQLYDVNGVIWAKGTMRQFYLSPTIKNTGLATILTALSLEKTVWVRIAGTGAQGSLITIVYINN